MGILINHGSWWVDFRFEKARIRKRSPVNTRMGAAEYEATLRTRLARGLPLVETVKEVPRFRDWTPEWMRLHVETNCKPSTRRWTEAALRSGLLPYFGNYRLSEITQVAVETYKNTERAAGLQNQTINNHLNLLSSCLRLAVETGLLTAMPRIKRLKAMPHPIRALAPDTVERLLGAADALARAMILVAACTGMRIGEICGLDWEDVDLAGKTIRVRQSLVEGVLGPTKNDQERLIPLPDRLVHVLALRAETNGVGPVFARRGHPLTYSAVRQLLNVTARRAGLSRLSWHMFRHTFCSELLNAGASIRTAKDLMGHSTILVTERYAHSTPKGHREAVDALPFGRLARS